MNRALTTSILGALAALAAVASPVRAEPAQATRPVVIELFTSQGCSSCPRANAILGELSKRDDVIALSWSVDYWDFLGWRDTYAQPAFAERQKTYCDNLGKRWRYTPQVVVDGAIDAKGGDFDAIETAILERRQLAGPGPTLSAWRDGAAIRVRVEGSSGAGQGEIWVAGYQPGEAKVAVKAGENKGRRVPHFNVVTSLEPVGEWTGGAAEWSTPAPDAPAAAILLNAPGLGAVLAAAVVDLEAAAP